MKTSPNDVSNVEILEALQVFSEQVDSRFESIDGRLGSMEGRLGSLEKDVAVVKSTIATLATKDYVGEVVEREVGKLKTTMVTKDYLDQKLADHHSDLVLWTRREIERHGKC